MTILQFHRAERGWAGPRIASGVRRVISRLFRKSPPVKRLASREAILERIEANKKLKALAEKYKKDKSGRAA